MFPSTAWALATQNNDHALLQKSHDQFAPFLAGERVWTANFQNYFCGGIGTAFLLWKGLLPEAAGPERRYVRQILEEAPRDPDGILCHPGNPEQHRIWIDVAFAVSPFLLFAGLAEDEEVWVEESFQQTAKMIAVLRNPENGLIRQARNFRHPGHITEDAWSRGNGWAAYALCELAAYLPANHPRRQAAVDLYLDHVRACAAFQNKDGLWHQEMTEPLSYVETSGSALMLYALGLGIDHGLVDRSELPRFQRGLEGLLPYITSEYDVHHTCRGCLCPGNGTKLDYMARSPQMNDPHAFGPMVLAFGQAAALGIHTVERNHTLC